MIGSPSFPMASSRASTQKPTSIVIGTWCEIFNSDQSSQFTSEAITSILEKNGIGISMHGKSYWRDNVLIERLWRSVKYEEVHLKAYDTVAEARASLSGISTFSIVNASTRALTARHRTRLSGSCLDAAATRTRLQSYRSNSPQIAAVAVSSCVAVGRS
jgi:transposase InsO family protein